MDKRKLGSQGLEVSAEGLGCMGMTWAYGAGDEEAGLETIRRALDSSRGVKKDAAEMMGPIQRVRSEVTYSSTLASRRHSSGGGTTVSLRDRDAT